MTRSVHDVEAFVGRSAAPVLARAGYRQRGLTYVLDGPRDRWAVVQFHPEALERGSGLRVGYGISTPAHRRFRESRGVEQESWPHVHESLLHGVLHSPESARTGAAEWVPPDTWVLGDEQHTDQVGAALAAALEDDVLPRLEAWFDPETLAETIKNRPRATFPGLSPRPRAVAMALLEADGAEEAVRQVLERLPPDDMVREWIEARLAAQG